MSKSEALGLLIDTAAVAILQAGHDPDSKEYKDLDKALTIAATIYTDFVADESYTF